MTQKQEQKEQGKISQRYARFVLKFRWPIIVLLDCIDPCRCTVC